MNTQKDSKCQKETIRIEVPDFCYSSTENNAKRNKRKIIGRDQEINRLKDQLINSEHRNGAYLVTGYRGMGKTSLVKEVMNEIKQGACKTLNTLIYIYITGLFLQSFFWAINNYSIPHILSDESLPAIMLKYSAIASCLLFILFLIYRGSTRLVAISKEEKGTFLNLRVIFHKIFYPEKDSSRIIIHINIGKKNTNDREILYLIAKQLETEFQHYLSNIGGHWRESLGKFIVVLLLTYTVFIHIINHDYWITDKIYNVIQQRHAYYFMLYFLLFVIGYYLINTIPSLIIAHFNISFATAQVIKKKIKSLNERIDSQITFEKGISTSGNSSIIGGALNTNKKKTYNLANAREIEYELIHVLAQMKHKYLSREIIIVFDELDKLMPDPSIGKTVEFYPEFDSSVSGFPNGGTSRKKKEEILNLLASLKYFISTAQAKFIFISGRELYDAYLADVSDREFSISSIFNDVIYVPSFLSDNEEKKDITSMTEKFICQKLIPSKYFLKDKKNPPVYTLKMYKKYLDETYQGQKQFNERDIHFLYKFILFLTYMSNGSPKKICHYFEKYIRTDNSPNNKRKYYLHFDVQAQQEISFIHYIAYPLCHAIINRASKFSDKLLVSALFLINHIYKYHNSGFSWRNMEYTPELLEVNKTPELRDFIDSILEFLKHTHLSPVISNLFGYKFPSPISEEISMYSKHSEMISAAFNFTLDESYSVKHYYHDLLKYYSQSCNKDNSHVVAGLHHVLGDLHLADEEYQEAIYEYRESLSCLDNELQRLDPNDAHYTNHILILTRTKLKLGLAFEKKKTYSSAYITYRELVSQLIKYRWFNENEMDLELKKEGEQYYLEKNQNSNNKYPYEWNDDKIPSEELAIKLSEHLNPDTTILMTKLSLFEDIRFPYQALLAKLFVLEKMELGGITKKNIDIVCSEFKYLLRTANIKDKYLIHADFYRKIGDILFYKNALNGSSNPYTYFNIDNSTNSSLVKIIIQCERRRNRSIGNAHIIPCYACQYYNKALKVLIQQMLNNGVLQSDDHQSRAYLILKFLSKRKNVISLKENELTLLANITDNLGNTLISCSNNKQDEISNEFINYLFKNIVLQNDKNLNTDSNTVEVWSCLPEQRSQLEKSILYFWAAAEAYKYASKLNEASFCYRKIISALIEYMANKCHDQLVLNDHLKNIELFIVNRAIQCIFSNYEHVNIPEIQSIKWMFNIEAYKNIPLNKLSLFPDIHETICMFHELNMLCAIHNNGQKDPKAKESALSFLNKCSQVSYSTKYQQIISLKLKALINRESFWEMYNENDSVSDESLFYEPDSYHRFITFITQPNLAITLDNLESLIIDSIDCLTQILELITPFTKTKMFTHSYLGNIYLQLFEWNKAFDYLYKYYANQKIKTKGKIKEELLFNKLIQRIGKRHTHYCIPNYQAEMAIKEYTRAQEMNSQGSTYKEMISHFYYLNDDLNNDYYKFYLALERYRNNCGNIDKQIKCLKKLYWKSSIYNSQSF